MCLPAALTLGLTALALGLTALAGAGPASAASTFYARGGGFGHGVGMSQYGAYGYALHGKDHRWILAHYYEGTQLGTTNPNQPVRVLLSSGPAAFAGATAAGKTHLHPGTTYEVKVLASGALKLVANSGKKIRATFRAPLTVTGPGPLQLAGKGTYRGSLQFSPDGTGGVQTVNVVGLDDYVRGVVASEMPSGWAMQALEAQAVAARTFAITGSVSGKGFELYDDTRSQVYGGVAAETPSTDQAVAATRGQIVTYNGQPALTYFFSSSGGHTESVQNVFAGATPEPWLRGVPDRYDDVAGNPNHRWQYGMSLATAAAKLGSLVEGRLLGITVIKHGVSPRIVEAAVVGTGGRRVVSGPALARIFGLPDTPSSFTTITTAAAGGELTGTIYPAPRRGTVAVQAWSGGAWRKLTSAPIRPHGHYAVVLPGAGRFRVTYGRLRGPRVTTTPVAPASVKVSQTASARGGLLRGVLPSWVNVYAGPHAWPTPRDRRSVRSVPLLLRSP